MSAPDEKPLTAEARERMSRAGRAVLAESESVGDVLDTCASLLVLISHQTNTDPLEVLDELRQRFLHYYDQSATTRQALRDAAADKDGDT